MATVLVKKSVATPTRPQQPVYVPTKVKERNSEQTLDSKLRFLEKPVETKRDCRVSGSPGEDLFVLPEWTVDDFCFCMYYCLQCQENTAKKGLRNLSESGDEEYEKGETHKVIFLLY